MRSTSRVLPHAIPKARGPIVASARWAVPASGEQVERDIEVLMHDRDDVLVAAAIVRYRLGPRR